jgi:hypothetical protein
VSDPRVLQVLRWLGIVVLLSIVDNGASAQGGRKAPASRI